MHLAGDVDELAHPPGGRALGGDPRHRVGVQGDLTVMERRLHQASLAQVEGALGGGQALSEVVLEFFEGAALGVVRRIGDHHAVDQVRGGQDVRRLGAEVDGHEPVVGGQGVEELQRTAPHGVGVADHGHPSRSDRWGGAAGGGHRGPSRRAGRWLGPGRLVRGAVGPVIGSWLW